MAATNAAQRADETMTTQHAHGIAGITNDHDGIYAVTPTDGKAFKTLRGAIRWLAKRGYNADGTRAKR